MTTWQLFGGGYAAGGLLALLALGRIAWRLRGTESWAVARKALRLLGGVELAVLAYLPWLMLNTPEVLTQFQPEAAPKVEVVLEILAGAATAGVWVWAGYLHWAIFRARRPVDLVELVGA